MTIAIDRLLNEHLNEHPQTRALATTEPQFRYGLEVLRATLQAVASSALARGVPAWQAEQIVRDTLGVLVTDQHAEARQRAATEPFRITPEFAEQFIRRQP